jgi:mono/diheme cytochrome c family protein
MLEEIAQNISNRSQRIRLAARLVTNAFALLLITPGLGTISNSSEPLKSIAAFRGPVDLVIAPSESWAATANELSGTASLVDLKSHQVLDEIAVDGHPVAIARLDDTHLAISCPDSGEVLLAEVANQKLSIQRRVQVGYLPHGLAVGKTVEVNELPAVYVGLQATGEIAEINFVQPKVVRRFAVGHWPRYLAVSVDGKRLAVGLSGEGSIAVVDVASGEVLYREPLSGGINLGHLQASADGVNVYFPWMIYRSNPINVRNIRRGWILASRAARVRFDGPADREAISLDVPGLAVSDPHGIAVTPNEHRLVVSSSGTHELLVYRLDDLPFIGAGGPGDLIDSKLLRDHDLFYRIPVGGRPMAVRALSDNRHMLVANHTRDELQIVDIEGRKQVDSISLGSIPSDSPDRQLVHRGMEIFYDGQRSLDQWYSCQSCHLDGGSNARPMDTWNDGTALTVKTVLPLHGVTETAPWTWHGWQNELDESIQNSFTDTMQGKEANAEDVRALRAYLASIELPPNPFLAPDGKLSETAEAGRKLFESPETACSTCHNGPTFSDGLNHDVGLGSDSDKYPTHNTPTLLGTYRKVRWLHDGRAKTLEILLTQYHSPEKVSGTAPLTDEQVRALVAYLKSL